VTQTVGGLMTRIGDAEGNITTISQTVNGLTVTDANGTTLINGGMISTTNLYVAAANITGQLTASQIKTSELIVGKNITMGSAARISWSQVTGTGDVATMDDIPTKTSDLTNDSKFTTLAAVESQGYTTSAQVTSITKDTVTTTFVNALDVTAANLKGGSISLLNAAGREAGSITLSSAVTANYAVDISAGSGGLRLLSGGSSALYLQAGGGGEIMIYNGNTTFTGSIKPNDDGGTYCGTSSQKWAAVYASTDTIQTSDRNAKHDIEELPDKYLAFLQELQPRRFKFNDGTSDRYHVGYIAQEVEELMTKHGIDSQEFAGFVKDRDGDGNEIYMLRYGEFIAIHTAAVRSIYKRLEKLEESA
jgi:hypothetical protein